MSSFLSLPREVRDMVYSLALVVGEVWPYRQTEARGYGHTYKCEPFDDVPSIRLLFTCRLIHDEAEPLLYMKNMIVLPNHDLTERFFTRKSA